MNYLKLIVIMNIVVGFVYSTTYNTPVLDGTITISVNDWDADENMGLRPGTGGEDWYHYLTWDANYIYLGFDGFNWPNNSNNHIVGHFDFIAGGTQTGINGESLNMTADFAFQLTRVGPSGVATYYQYDKATSTWVSNTIIFPSTEIAYNAITDDTELRFSWSTLTQGLSSGPSSFAYYAAVENNSDEITQIWPLQSNPADPTAYDCGVFEAGPVFIGESPNTLPVVCEPTDQPLPVELSSFTVENSLQGVLCKWTTESEVENLGFILERNTNGFAWQEIVSYKTDNGLLGQGTTSSYTDYEYVDKLTESNTTYEYRLADVDYNGVVTYHSVRTVKVEKTPLPSVVEEFTVLPAYPNPFNPSTTITYGIETDNNVIINIYDITGKLINTLQNGYQLQGWHSIIWNGTNQNGEQVPAGIYLSKITSNTSTKTTKLMLLK